MIVFLSTNKSHSSKTDFKATVNWQKLTESTFLELESNPNLHQLGDCLVKKRAADLGHLRKSPTGHWLTTEITEQRLQ